MEVRIAELRRVVNKLLDDLVSRGLDRVEISHDCYWSVPKESRYNPYEEPKELTIGQLSDDVQELYRIEADETPAVSYALV